MTTQERKALEVALAEFENQKAGLEEVGVTDHSLDELITTIKEALMSFQDGAQQSPQRSEDHKERSDWNEQVEPCPDKERNEYVCKNRNQCWEPCGELGKSEEHVKVYEQVEPIPMIVKTAPERIWLDIGFDPSDEDEISFNELVDATWSQDNATGYGIEYVRADIYPPVPTAQPKPLTNEQAEQILLDMAAHVEKFANESATDVQMSGECIRYILERVAAHGIKE